MVIDTNTLKPKMPYVLGGAASGLVLALFIPAGTVLTVGIVAAAGIAVCRRLSKSRTLKENELTSGALAEESTASSGPVGNGD